MALKRYDGAIIPDQPAADDSVRSQERVRELLHPDQVSHYTDDESTRLRDVFMECVRHGRGEQTREQIFEAAASLTELKERLAQQVQSSPIGAPHLVLGRCRRR